MKALGDWTIFITNYFIFHSQYKYDIKYAVASKTFETKRDEILQKLTQCGTPRLACDRAVLGPAVSEVNGRRYRAGARNAPKYTK